MGRGIIGAVGLALWAGFVQADQAARASEIEMTYWRLTNTWTALSFDPPPSLPEMFAERLTLDGCRLTRESLRSDAAAWIVYVSISIDLTRAEMTPWQEDRFHQIGPESDPWGLASIEFSYPDGSSFRQWDDRMGFGVLAPTTRLPLVVFLFGNIETKQEFEDFLILLHGYQADFCRLTG